MTKDNAPLDANQEFSEFLSKIYIPVEIQRDFYLFIAIFTDWLDKAGIPYFLHSGTALGAVRHHGFIPWDDDFDIMIEEEFEQRLTAGFHELEKYGIKLSDNHRENGHYQFYFKHRKIASTANRYYCFDIFVGMRDVVEGRPVLHYKHPDFNSWFNDRYCHIEDVFPLKKVDFGPLSLWAMKDPTDYFRRSSFRTDEATLRIHMIDQKWLAERMSYFGKLGLYPIRDPAILQYRPAIDLNYTGLDEYLLS